MLRAAGRVKFPEYSSQSHQFLENDAWYTTTAKECRRGAEWGRTGCASVCESTRVCSFTQGKRAKKGKEKRKGEGLKKQYWPCLGLKIIYRSLTWEKVTITKTLVTKKA